MTNKGEVKKNVTSVSSSDIARINTEYLKNEKKRQKEEDKSLKKVLDYVKSLISLSQYEDVLETMKESDYTYNYQITDVPRGVYQKEDNYWVNQTADGGFTGDEFAGTISILLPNNKYFQFNYSM